MPAMTSSLPPVLSVTGLSVTFGGVRAVDGLDLDVGAGELVGLIGPNGAGKTTTIDALTGFVDHAGTIALAGYALDGLRPHERASRGLSRTWQSAELFDDLTVEENAAVAATRASWRTTLRELVRGGRAASGPEVDHALELVGLTEHADRYPLELPHGYRALVGIARAVASRPTLVLLDEPAAGLDTGESQALASRLRAVVDDGVGALLVDHDMGLVLSVCDRVYVLDFGRVIAAGPPSAIRDDPAVVAAYLGEQVAPASS
jgi:branched-chain amino acid transport system ATP-binding protein